jgi:quinol-cytochrome oxidoreductase complex cytochrome b subunit
MFGSLVRAVHHWSANLLVVTTFLHLLRVFFTAAFKQGRTMNWLIGVTLFALALASNFTGYLLPWDQLAYWAITVSTSLLGYIPAVGLAIRNFFLAGPQVGQAALSNFYAMHVVFLPFLMTALMMYHFWKVRKNGGISQPVRKENERVERLSTIPHLVNVEFAAGAVVLAGVMLWSMFFPAPLGEIANPVTSPNPAKAAWYFLGLQELLLHMHPGAALGLFGLLGAALLLTPYFDQNEQDIGVYFRSAVGRKAALLGGLLGLNLTPLLVVLDEYWLDLPGWLPTFPAALTTGAVPFLATVAALALIYAGLRASNLHEGQKANHSEALLGVFSFVIAALVVLTIIGIFFRGPNMALVLPF